MTALRAAALLAPLSVVACGKGSPAIRPIVDAGGSNDDGGIIVPGDAADATSRDMAAASADSRPASTLTTNLLNWNEPGASGTNWPGWTYKADASGYGQPGWWKNDGQACQGDPTDWRIRAFQKPPTDMTGTSTGTIDPTDRAPSTATGASFVVRGSSAATYPIGWWLFYDCTNLGMHGYTDQFTDRWSFYMKTEGTSPINPDALSGSEIQLGTYLSWGSAIPKEGPGNQHFYHETSVSPGAWIHIEFDAHPEHLRGEVGTFQANEPRLASDGIHYFQGLIQAYFEISYQQPGTPALHMDEMTFYSTQSTAEPHQNDVSISTVWVGRWPNGDWEISWKDASFASTSDKTNSVFDVRYSGSPITNANFAQATQIAPRFHAVDTNLVRRQDPANVMAWTRFNLPADFEAGKSRVYFAIRDVSVAGGHVGAYPYASGDGHSAPSPLIHTIDYALAP